MTLQPSDRVVILGAGHAGGRAALHLRRTGFSGVIVLVGDENEGPYERPALSKDLLLGTKRPADILLQQHHAWVELGVDLMLASPVSSVDADARLALLQDGRQLGFDHLIIATGGVARRLTIPGSNRSRVLTLRTMQDSLALAGHLSAIRRLVVIGGGVIGLEVAAAARKRGIAVTLLEASDRLMARVGPPILSAWLLDQHRAADVDVRLRARVAAIDNSGPALTVVGQEHPGRHLAIETDLVLVAVGIDPAVGCLRATGLPLCNGIVVDARCQVPGRPIYAVGDVANTYSPLFKTQVRLETWRNAENQPKAVVEFLHGRSEPYVEIPWMWSDQYDRNIQVVGLWSDDADVIVRGDAGARGSSCLFVRHGVVTGGVLWDLGRDRRFLEKLVGDARVHDPRQLADPTVSLRSLT